MMSDKEPEVTEDKAMQPDLVDVRKRSEAFIKDFGDLTKKHKIDLAVYPVFIPDGQGHFIVNVQQQCVDITNQPYRSPFMAKE